ncbi:MAG: hypothetical protein V2A61_07485, partial [Calditrichota bacterium]
MTIKLPKPRSILIIRLSSAGDILLTSLLIGALRRKFPRARLDILVKEPFAELAQGLPGLNERFAWSGSLKERSQLLQNLRSVRYDA